MSRDGIVRALSRVSSSLTASTSASTFASPASVLGWREIHSAGCLPSPYAWALGVSLGVSGGKTRNYEGRLEEYRTKQSRSFRSSPLVCEKLAPEHNESASVAGQLASIDVEVSPPGPEIGPPAHGMVLHGLLGQGKNLRTFTRMLASKAAQLSGRKWRLVLPDLRNHGDTAQRPGFPAPHTIPAAAGDVIRLLRTYDAQGIRFSVLAGHSLGGKIAMEILQQIKDAECEGADPALMEQTCRAKPRQVWVLDSIPGRVNRDMSARGVDQVLGVLRSIPMPVASRKELHATLTKQLGLSEDLAAWLGSSLVQLPNSNMLRFGFNIAGAAAMYSDYRSSEYWDILALPPKDTRVHLIRAERSDRWTPHDLRMLERVAAESKSLGAETGTTDVHVLSGAGHWLHADNPRGLVDMMAAEMVRALADSER